MPDAEPGDRPAGAPDAGTRQVCQGWRLYFLPPAAAARHPLPAASLLAPRVSGASRPLFSRSCHWHHAWCGRAGQQTATMLMCCRCFCCRWTQKSTTKWPRSTILEVGQGEAGPAGRVCHCCRTTVCAQPGTASVHSSPLHPMSRSAPHTGAF